MRVGTLISLSILIAVVLIVGCAKDTKMAQNPNQPVVDHVLSPDSVSIEYEVAGTGDKAVVLIHCWCCDRSYFENQIKFLEPHYKVVAIDLAGHGSSGNNRENWTVASYAQDVATVVNHLGLKDIVLVGHSMGAMVSLEAADLLKGKVHGVIGVDNYHNFNQKLPPEQIDGLITLLGENFGPSTKQFVTTIFSSEADSSLVERISKDMSEAPETVGIESMRSLLNFSYIDALAKLDIPVRGIHGDLQPTDLDGNRTIYEDFNALIIPGTGHFPHLEKPDQFNSELQKFLDNIWAENK